VRRCPGGAAHLAHAACFARRFAIASATILRSFVNARRSACRDSSSGARMMAEGVATTSSCVVAMTGCWAGISPSSSTRCDA
jgi:hypothetical protein